MQRNPGGSTSDVPEKPATRSHGLKPGAHHRQADMTGAVCATVCCWGCIIYFLWWTFFTGPVPTTTTVIVGAGFAGISAARTLTDVAAASGLSHRIIVLEGQDRIGGRVHTDYSLGTGVDMGAVWIHRAFGNPLKTDLVLPSRKKPAFSSAAAGGGGGSSIKGKGEEGKTRQTASAPLGSPIATSETENGSIMLFDAQGRLITAEQHRQVYRFVQSAVMPRVLAWKSKQSAAAAAAASPVDESIEQVMRQAISDISGNGGTWVDALLDGKGQQQEHEEEQQEPQPPVRAVKTKLQSQRPLPSSASTPSSSSSSVSKLRASRSWWMRSSLEFIFFRDFVQDHTASMSTCSAAQYDSDDYAGVGKDELIPEGGYLSLLRPLADGLDVRTGKGVAAVLYGGAVPVAAAGGGPARAALAGLLSWMWSWFKWWLWPFGLRQTNVPAGGARARVVLADGTWLDADHVIVTAPLGVLKASLDHYSTEEEEKEGDSTAEEGKKVSQPAASNSPSSPVSPPLTSQETAPLPPQGEGSSASSSPLPPSLRRGPDVSALRGQRPAPTTLQSKEVEPGLIQFQPPLPRSNALAIRRLGFGRSFKIALLFKRRFWPEEVHFIGKLGSCGGGISSGGGGGSSSRSRRRSGGGGAQGPGAQHGHEDDDAAADEEEEEPELCFGRGQHWEFTNVARYSEGHLPILLGETEMEFSDKLTAMTDEEVVAHVMADLRSMRFDTVGSSGAGAGPHNVDDASAASKDELKRSTVLIEDPVRVVIKRFNSEPFTRGALSFARPSPHTQSGKQSAEQLYQDVEAPVGPGGQVIFAGEHCNWLHPATVHGSYLSGMQAARRILDGNFQSVRATHAPDSLLHRGSARALTYLEKYGELLPAKLDKLKQNYASLHADASDADFSTAVTQTPTPHGASSKYVWDRNP